jgi:hypothetical protein
VKKSYKVHDEGKARLLKYNDVITREVSLATGNQRQIRLVQVRGTYVYTTDEGIKAGGRDE